MLLAALVALAGCALDSLLPATPASLPTAPPSLALRLVAEEMPPADALALAEGFRPGEAEAPASAPTAATSPGARQAFWVSDPAAGELRQVTATLQVALERVEMWVEEGAVLDAQALERSARTFEERIYPTMLQHFAPDWYVPPGPGARLVVLHARISGAAGYFSRANLAPRAANPFSNERAMFVMNLGALTPGTAAYEGVLAHEFQHMIHGTLDPNEDAWVNEGLAELAQELTGYGRPAGRALRFAAQPDLQLTHWPEEDSLRVAHYGASYLFCRYLYERFGEEAIRRLVAEPANGLRGVGEVLRALGRPEGVGDVYADWLLANALDTEAAWGNSVHRYATVDLRAAREETPAGVYEASATVQPYGADYYALSADAPRRVTFAGQPQTQVLPNAPASGAHYWWSNRGDGGHATLERRLDLRTVTSAALSFAVWYDLEEGWDYAYVRASRDGGLTWQALESPRMRATNPHGAALGPGYTGRSGGGAEPVWVRETLDLTPLAGAEVLLRFDYVTDDTVNLGGLCLDDLAVEAIGWHDDVEGGEEGWTASGFLRHDNALAQEWLVLAARLGDAAPAAEVRRLTVDAQGRGEWTLEAGEWLLVVSALAPRTTLAAPYTLALAPAPNP